MVPIMKFSGSSSWTKKRGITVVEMLREQVSHVSETVSWDCLKLANAMQHCFVSVCIQYCYLRQRAYVMPDVCPFVCLSVCLFVCLSVCLSVSNFTQKLLSGSWWKLRTRKKWLNFERHPHLDSGSRYRIFWRLRYGTFYHSLARFWKK